MVSLMVKEFPAMYVTRCFITTWTKNRCRPVCCHIKAVRKAEECVDIWYSVVSQSAFLQRILSHSPKPQGL
jgi:glucose/arabinose dehydrogenase